MAHTVSLVGWRKHAENFFVVFFCPAQVKQLPVLTVVQDDATEAEWYDVTKLPPLAFDHKLVVRTAFEHLIQQAEAKSTGAQSMC